MNADIHECPKSAKESLETRMLAEITGVSNPNKLVTTLIVLRLAFGVVFSWL